MCSHHCSGSQKWRFGHKKQHHSTNATYLAQSELQVYEVRKRPKGRAYQQIQKVCAKASWQLRTAYCSSVNTTPSCSTLDCLGRYGTIIITGCQLECNITRRSYPVQPSTPSQFLCIAAAPARAICISTHNISVCFGCKRCYGKPVNLPNHLCVMHHEWRTFTQGN